MMYENELKRRIMKNFRKREDIAGQYALGYIGLHAAYNDNSKK